MYSLDKVHLIIAKQALNKTVEITWSISFYLTTYTYQVTKIFMQIKKCGQQVIVEF